MTDNDIRRVLDAAAPQEPGFDGWGDKVRRGHRRRRAAITSVTALALVALGVPVVMQLATLNNTPTAATPSPLVTDSPSSSGSTSPTATPSATGEPTSAPNPIESTTGPLVSPQCVSSVGVVTKLPDGGLPSGATKIWLCDGDQEPMIPTYGPPEALIEGIDAAIAAFNALPVQGQRECPDSEYEQAYTVVVEYPDREPIRLSGVTHGCKEISDGSTTFGGGDTYFDTLVGLWQKQRNAASYELIPDGSKVCVHAKSAMGVTLDAAVRGFACGVPVGATSMHDDIIQRHLDPALVRRITEAAKSEATPMPATEPYPWSQTLVLLNRFGDPITLYRAGDTFYWEQGKKFSEWQPKADLLTELNTVTEGMLTGQPPVDPSTDEPCGGMLVNSDRPLTGATGATLCLNEPSAAKTTAHQLPDELFRTIVDALSKSTDVLAADVNVEVTGSYIGLPAEEGRMFQVFIASDGTLLWSRYDLSLVRWQPTPEVRAWLVSKGVPIKG